MIASTWYPDLRQSVGLVDRDDTPACLVRLLFERLLKRLMQGAFEIGLPCVPGQTVCSGDSDQIRFVLGRFGIRIAVP